MARARYQDWIDEQGREQVRKWAAAGYTDVEIAAQIGVSRKTIYEWAKKYPDFGAALAAGQERSNEAVETALYDRCLGYNRAVKKTFKLRRVEYDPQTGRKIAEYEELVDGVDEVHVPADVTAQKFWLTNRVPERWANKVEFEGAVTGSLEEYLRTHGPGTQN